MPVSDSEEHGVKVEKQSCDFLCMPPKKRHLFRFQSMGTISQPVNSLTSGFQQEHIQPAQESEHVLNSQGTPPGETLERKSSAEVKEYLFNNQEMVVDTFPDTSRGQTPGVDATVSTAFMDYGSADVDARELECDNNFQLSSEELNLQPAVNNPDQPSILSSTAFIDHGKTNVSGKELDVANNIQPSSEETDLQSAVEKPDQPSILSTSAFIDHRKADEKGKELDDENNLHPFSEEMELLSEVKNPDLPSIISSAALIDQGKVDVNGKEFEGGNKFQPCHEEMHLQSAVEKPSQPTILRSTTFIDHGKIDVNSKKRDNNFQLSSQEMGLQSAIETQDPPFMPRSISEKIPSEKSAFRKVEERISSAGSLAFPVQSHNCNESIVKPENLGMQSRDLAPPKVPMDVQCKVAEVVPAQQHSNRTNWDLNTMMDAWEGPLKQDQGELCSQFLRDFDKNIIAIPVGIPFCEYLHTNPHLKLEFYPSNVNKPDLQSGMPLRLPLSSSCNSVSDLSLSITSASGTSNFSPSASVKSEPFNDKQGCWSYVELASQQSLYKAVKPEPHEEAIIECSNLLPKTNTEVGQHVASMLAVKLESKSEGQNCALRQVRTMDEDTSTIPTNENGADRSKVNADYDLASANEIANCNDNCSHLVQMSSVWCPQISATSTTSNLDPLPKPQGFEKSEFIKSPNSASVGDDSSVGTAVAEAVSQMDTVMIDSASLNVSPSHITPIAVLTALQRFNAGEKIDVISKMAVPVPSEFKCVYDTASQLTDGASMFDYKQDSGSMLRVANVDLMDSSVQTINFDTSTSLSSGDDSLESNVTHKNEAVHTVVLSSQVLKEGLHVNENVSGHQSTAVNFQLKPKLHMDEDDDIEDGEVRDLHIQRNASGSSCDSMETDKSCLEQPVSLVTAVTLPSPSLLEGDKGVVETREQRQEVFTEPSSDSNVNSCDRNDGNIITHIQNPTHDLGENGNLNKSKLVKISRTIPTYTQSKEKRNEAKQHSKGSNGGCKALSGGGAGEAGSNIAGHGLKVLPSDQSCPSKSGLLEKVNDNTMQSSSSRSRIVNLAPASKDSAVAEKSSEKCLPSKIERERSSEKSMHGDGLYRRGIRNASGDAGVRKFDKESKKEDTPNTKVEGDFARSRARNDKQFETFRSEWNADTDYASEHFGRPNNYRYLKSRNTSDVAFAGMDGPIESVSRIVHSPPMVDDLGNFSHVSRRRSPAARDRPMNVGVHIISRPRRNVSPGRCADGVSDMVLVGREERFMHHMADDVVDPSAIAGARSNFEREETFIQRGRSVSPPLLRRGAPRLSRIRSPSSTRQARSPRQWSPQRSLDSFNVRWEAVRGRSPNLQVVRMRSPPNPRDSYIEGVVPGRRCGSPTCIPRLHDDVRDVGPSREFEYARGGAPIQRNVRRLRVIDPRGNDEEFFGLVHPRPRIHDLLEDERFSDRRGAPERHGIIRHPRHRFAEPAEEDIDFQIEHEAPRPVRLRMGEEEEFLDRGRPRGGGIRNQLRELPRRFRGVEEREDGRAWHEADFNDVRMKRRRF